MAPLDPHWCKPRPLCQHVLASSWLYGRKSCRPGKPRGSGRLSGVARVWPSGFAGLSRWGFAPGMPLPAPEGNSQRSGWLSKLSLSQPEPLALLPQPSQGWLTPHAGCSTSQTAGACVPAHVSYQLLPSDAVWAGVTLSAAVAPAKHHRPLHKRRWGG